MLQHSMKKPGKMTLEESGRFAAKPQPPSLRSRGAGKATMVGDGSAPKKHRKMSTAWRTMIAVTEKARCAKAAGNTRP